MKLLSNKKVLYVAPRFFNYENEIIKALEHLGAAVDYYDDRPANDFFTKALIRLNVKFAVQKRINNYYMDIVETTKYKEYDFVFFVDMETIPEAYMNLLRACQKKATFLLYMWDSMDNKNISSLLPYFDKCFTFDPHDSKSYRSFELLPLFYIPDYDKISVDNSNYEYDLCFIGTAHSDRCQLVERVRNEATKKGMSLYSFLFCHSYILFLFRKIFDSRYRKVKLKDLSFKSLSKEEILEIIQKSKCVVDFQHPGQNGLTMRTFEILGASRKLITTNSNVKDCDFYRANNILVVDREEPNISEEFISSEYDDVGDDIRKSYSLNLWLEKIFSCN